MLLWFAGASIVIVWAVFQSPAIDYRLVMLGSVLPVGEVLAGRALVLHTLAASVAALGLVMLATRERRLVRRRWIGLPIGLMLHLVLDGVWARSETFWWPFFGWGFPADSVPEAGLAGVWKVLLEVAGIAALVWAYRRFGLADPERRDRFIRSGQFDRDLAR